MDVFTWTLTNIDISNTANFRFKPLNMTTVILYMTLSHTYMTTVGSSKTYCLYLIFNLYSLKV